MFGNSILDKNMKPLPSQTHHESESGATSSWRCVSELTSWWSVVWSVVWFLVGPLLIDTHGKTRQVPQVPPPPQGLCQTQFRHFLNDCFIHFIQYNETNTEEVRRRIVVWLKFIHSFTSQDQNNLNGRECVVLRWDFDLYSNIVAQLITWSAKTRILNSDWLVPT